MSAQIQLTFTEAELSLLLNALEEHGTVGVPSEDEIKSAIQTQLPPQVPQELRDAFAKQALEKAKADRARAEQLRDDCLILRARITQARRNPAEFAVPEVAS